MEKLLGHLIGFGFFALPVAAVVWFLVSLVGFCKAKPQRQAQAERFNRWRRSLIAAAIVAGVLVILCAAILLMLAAAVAHM